MIDKESVVFSTFGLSLASERIGSRWRILRAKVVSGAITMQLPNLPYQYVARCEWPLDQAHKANHPTFIVSVASLGWQDGISEGMPCLRAH
jgi:hypothetical protein